MENVSLIDSHCHLDKVDLAPFEGSLQQMLDAAARQGISHMLCVGTSRETQAAMLDLIMPYDNIFASVGVHPDHADCLEPETGWLTSQAENPRVVAIGETGLDYYYDSVSRDVQLNRFEIHLEAAQQTGLPLVIHSRDARRDTIDLLRNNRAENVGGVMHCFTEDWDMAKQALDLGFYISFSGIVTFRNADSVRDVASRVPMDRLLVETDSPYLTPVPLRGKPNSPANVFHVASCLAELRQTDLASIAQITSENFFRLFAKTVQ